MMQRLRVAGGCAGAVLVLALLAGLVGVALWCGTGGRLFESDEDRAIRVFQEGQAAALAQAQAQAVAPYQTLAWQAIWLAAAGLALAGPAVWLWVRADTHRRTRWQLSVLEFEPERPLITQGQLASPHGAALQAGTVQGYWLARAEEARNVGTPEHYAPVIHQLPGPLAPALLDNPAPAVSPLLAAPVEAVSLETLMARGAFGQGQYYAGTNAADGTLLWQAPAYGRSLLAAAQGGGGKSTLMVGSVCQDLLIPPAARGIEGLSTGARFIVIDWQANKPQSLTRRLGGMLDNRVLMHARTPAEVQRACALFYRIMRRRIDQGVQPGDDYPLILVVDEVSTMFDEPDYEDVTDGLITTFRRANTQYRAVGGAALAAVHMLQAYMFGGKAGTKRSFYTRMIGRLDAADATLAGLPLRQAESLQALPPGSFYAMGSGLLPTKVLWPEVTAATLDAAMQEAARWDRPSRATVVMPVAGSRATVAGPDAAPTGATTVADTPATGATEGDSRVQQALAHFDSSGDLPAAIERAYNVSRKSPGAYGPAYTAVTAALRAARQKGTEA